MRIVSPPVLIGKNLYGGGILGGRHACDLFELPREIVDAVVTEKLSDLREIVVILAYDLLRKLNFQSGEVINDPTVVPLTE